MLTILLHVIPNSCQFLLLLVLLFVLLLVIHCTIQKTPGSWIPCLGKKQKKNLAPWITPLEEAKEIGGSETEKRSSEDQNLVYTLQTLDKNIHYLAWQMQRISGPMPHSASSTSVESVTSICSWTRTSVRGDAPLSRSGTPPSPAPAAQKGEDPKWQQQQQQQQLSLVRPSGAEFQQSRHQESLSHHKVDFSMCQKQLQEQGRGGPTPQSVPLTRLIPPAPSLCPAAKGGSHAHQQSSTSRLCFLDYKEQELLDWHVQRKHQPKEAAPALPPLASGVITGTEIRALTGTVGPSSGGRLPRGSQQPPPRQRPRSHTPPQVIVQGCRASHKPHFVQSPGPVAWPPLPAPEDLLPPPILVCKTESRSSLRSLTEGKGGGSGGAPNKDLAELLSLLGQSRSPTLREAGRPGTPKEREKEGHSCSSSGRPGTPKEGHGSVGRAGSPKVKPEDVEVSMMMDRKVRRLSWADVMPEAQRVSGRIWEPPAAACPKFLDPSFMCQNQLEMPCIAAARVELLQEGQPFAKPPRRPQCLAHTIVESLDMKQAMQDLHMCLAKGLEKGHSQPSVEYPICLLCGRCTPYCPHPRPRHSPCLLVYPRLSVQDGEVHMTLGFLLKIKRSEADEWGLVQGGDAPKARWGREGPPKKERSRSRRRRGRAGRHHSRAPEKARPRALEGGDLRIRSRGAVQKGMESTAGPTSPQPHKARRRRAHGKQAPLAGDEQEELPPKKHPSILRRLLLCIKKAWARMRGRREKTPPQHSSVTFSSKPESHPEEEVLSIVSPAPEVQKRGGILLNRKDSLLVMAPETPPKHWTPTAQHETAPFRKGSPKSHRRAACHFAEPEPPWAPKKGNGRRKK